MYFYCSNYIGNQFKIAIRHVGCLRTAHSRGILALYHTPSGPKKKTFFFLEEVGCQTLSGRWTFKTEVLFDLCGFLTSRAHGAVNLSGHGLCVVQLHRAAKVPQLDQAGRRQEDVGSYGREGER